MSYALVLGVAGGIIGSFVPVIGTQIGFAVGAAIGGYIDTTSTKVTNDGPRLDDKSIQTNDEGSMLPILKGTLRFSGTVVWSTDLIEVKTAAKTGGKGAPQVTDNTYTYEASFLVLLGQGQIAGIRRIWANKQLIYSIGDDANAQTIIASSTFAQSVTVLTGVDSQMPSSLIESYVGVGNSPAYRGRFGILFENFQCGGVYGNHLPQIECEAVAVSNVVITYNNFCSLTPNDAGAGMLRGRSWITNTKVYLWRQVGGSTDYGHVALFISTNGEEKTVIASSILIPEANNWELLPVNTQSRFMFETVKNVARTSAPFGTTQRLYVIDPIVSPTVDDDGRRFVDLALLQGDDYWLAGGSYRMTAYDEDSEVVAFAMRDTGVRYYGERISVIKAGTALNVASGGGVLVPSGEVGATPLGEYLIRPAGTGGATVICALACSFGRVFALVYYAIDDKMHLLILSQEDASLISDFPGPVNSQPSSGTEILDAIRTDGSSVWAWTTSGGFVLKWTADGTCTTLARNINVQDDSGAMTNALGGQQCFIGDDHLIMQGEVQLNNNTTARIFRHQVVHWNAVQPADVTLASIVQSECDYRGVLCDVISLAGIMVHGYLVSRQMPSRNVIEFLASVYRFDAYEDGSTLVFVLRGADPVRTLTLADLGAHESGADAPDPITIQRQNETDLPQAVTINFTNKDNAYQPGSLTTHRLNTISEQQVTLDVTALSLTSAEASKIADVAMMEAWVNRDTFKWSTNYQHADLMPTNVVLLNGGDAIYRVRITKRTDNNGLLEFEGTADDPFIVQSAATSVGGVAANQMTVGSASVLTLLDIPILQDSDNDAGAYARITPAGPNWSGGTVFKVDGAPSALGAATQSNAVGFTATVLGDYAGVGSFDESNTVDVLLTTPGATLSSVSRPLALAGQNAFLVGDEILVARNAAALTSPGSYRLSGLLRYQRGTEGATHVAGERVVPLNTPGTVRFNNGSADIGVIHQYEAVSNGASVDPAAASTFINHAIGLRPFAPVQLAAGYSAGGDVLMKWKRRTRLSATLRSNVDAPLGEETESYLVEIAATSAFATIVRRYTVTAQACTYLNADRYVDEQAGLPSPFFWRVAQVSAVFGAGKRSAVQSATMPAATAPSSG